MSDSRLLAGLPFDVLLKILSECDVGGVLNLSATCRSVNEAAGEHQIWLDQARRLQIPFPTGTIPPTGELKEWAISWFRSDERWVKPWADDRSLNLHSFDMRQRGGNEAEDIAFRMANLVPGGKFVVVLYTDYQIDLKEIKIGSEDKWDLQDVARYKQDDPEDTYGMFPAEFLTDTNLGRPLVAYVDQQQENLLVFLVDHVASTIERKQVVKLPEIHNVYSIHARGSTIVCFCNHDYGWAITVSELGPNPAMKLFVLNTNHIMLPWEIQIFMVSENAVVMCDEEGIHLYHIPELSSAEVFSILSPVWEWLAESKWFYGSACTTFSRHPVLYLYEGASGTHTITLCMDASGRNPVVAEHHISRGLRHGRNSISSLEREDVCWKGGKGLRWDISGPGAYLMGTCLLGREDLEGGFSAKVDLEVHRIRFADFDERTGRILVATNRRGAGEEGIRVQLADLPP